MKHIQYYNIFLNESIKNARKILGDSDVLNRILEIDPTLTKKYSGWIAKNYKKDPWNNDKKLKDLISKYDSLISRRKIEKNDINSFVSISDLDNYIKDKEKNISLSNKESRSNYDVILDNSEVLILLPKSHDASKKLGLTTFSTGINPKTGSPDCRWCITYSNPDNWYSNFYFDLSTYYFVKIKNNEVDYPNDKIAVGVRPIMENGKIKYPIETGIYYTNSTDHGLDLRGSGENKNHVPQWQDEHLAKIDNIMEPLKHLFKPAYLKERFFWDEFKNYALKYPNYKSILMEKYPELFDPYFELEFNDI